MHILSVKHFENRQKVCDYFLMYEYIMIINKAFLIVTNAQHFENRQEVCDDIFNV